MSKSRKDLILNLLYAFFAVLAVVFFAFRGYFVNVFKNYVYSNNIVCIDSEIAIHYIDVGEGNAVAFKLKTGEVGLIDAGSTDTAQSVYSYLKENVLETDSLDYLILTHTDSDHLGGSLNILSRLDVKNILIPNISETKIDNADLYEEFVKYSNVEVSLGAKFSYIQDGLTFNLGNVKFEFFGPLKEYSDENNYSPIIRISNKNVAYLFMGDIERTAEEDIVEKYSDRLLCDVVLIAHHGSAYSNSYNFLKSTNAKYAIISVGENSYGHPADSTIETLLALGCKIYTTLDYGNICAYDKSGIIDFILGDALLQSYNFTFEVIFLIYLLILIAVGVHRLINQLK